MPAPPATSSTAAPATSAPGHQVAALNNPAQQPDPGATVSCSDAPEGHACVSGRPPLQIRTSSNSATATRTSWLTWRPRVASLIRLMGDYLSAQDAAAGQSIQVHSPTTGKHYSVSCSPSSGLIGCVGSPLSTGIYVSFPQNAVDSQTQDEANAYASSHDVGSPAPASTPTPTPPGSTRVTGSGAGFCTTHICIGNFDNGTGYIVQCVDGEWSHSGGRPGACSDHGGETGTMYP